MNSEAVWSFGSMLEGMLSPLDTIYNNVNYLVIALGFVGFIYWMVKQSKFNKEAESNPDQLK